MVENIGSMQLLDLKRDSCSLTSFGGMWPWMMTVMNWVAPIPAADFFFFFSDGMNLIALLQASDFFFPLPLNV